MNYFSQPPQPELGRLQGNYPRFMKKWYRGKNFDVQYVLDLFNWGDQEYTDTVIYAIAKQDEKLYKFVTSLTSYHVVASSKEFSELVKNMTQELWNSLPKSVRNALNETYKIYSSKNKNNI